MNVPCGKPAGGSGRSDSSVTVILSPVSDCAERFYHSKTALSKHSQWRLWGSEGLSTTYCLEQSHSGRFRRDTDETGLGHVNVHAIKQEVCQQCALFRHRLHQDVGNCLRNRPSSYDQGKGQKAHLG
jgi:hypothetical protein